MHTRKAIDFKLWTIALLLHKKGYYYLPEGRQLFTDISNIINKCRYSTTTNIENTNVIVDDIFKRSLEIFATNPPFDVSSGMSHMELAKKFTISKGGRSGFAVHIYDLELGKELTGSPFSSYGAGHVAIGLSAGSRAIGRNIDTGKVFKGRYIFSSVPITPPKS